MYPPKTLLIVAAEGPPGVFAAVNHKALVVTSAGPNMMVFALSEFSPMAFNKNVPAVEISSTRSTRIRTSYVRSALIASVWPGLVWVEGAEVEPTSTPNSKTMSIPDERQRGNGFIGV